MIKKYQVVIVVSLSGTEAEKAQLIAHMIKRIKDENATVGQCTAYVSAVTEQK